jgi:hypothetical protein
MDRTLVMSRRNTVLERKTLVQFSDAHTRDTSLIMINAGEDHEFLQND